MNYFSEIQRELLIGIAGLGRLRAGILVLALPALLMVTAFYSLVLHMHQALGGWPQSIGERGFPPALILHAHLVQDGFVLWLLLTVWLLPLLTLICVFVRGWRRFIPYLGMHAVFFFLCIGLMYLAPEGFVYWWKD